MRTLVVLPTYNEADNIAEVLRRLRTTVPAADILVVDDASTDGTAAIALARGAELGGVDVLMRVGADAGWNNGVERRSGLWERRFGSPFRYRPRPCRASTG